MRRLAGSPRWIYTVCSLDSLVLQPRSSSCREHVLRLTNEKERLAEQ